MKIQITKWFVRVILMTQIVCVAQANIKLAGPFSDHMVLQRDRPIPVWGWAEPGETVTVTIEEHSATVTADDSGRWKLELPAMSAGTGYSMLVKSDQTKATIEILDVAIGEVWLASGQSNMQWTLKKSDPAELIMKPNSQIRQYQGGSRDFRKPTGKSWGKWVVDEGSNRLDFSAVAYYFANSLHDELDVPIGILLAAVGGTVIETWMDRDVVESIAEVREESQMSWERYEGYPEQRAKQVRALQRWRQVNGRGDPKESVNFGELLSALDAPWSAVSLPYKWPDSDYSGYGVLWMENSFEVTEATMENQHYYLRFGAVNTFLDIFVNGKLVHEITPENHRRLGNIQVIRIPEDSIVSGNNEILIRVDSPTQALEFTKTISVDGTTMDRDWGVQIEADYGVLSESELSTLPEQLEEREPFNRLSSVHYNTKIFPKKDYAIRGCIWYQGEANAHINGADDYAKLFPVMIRSWRELWGQPNLPFYFCQLSTYGYKKASLREDSWADLRNVQKDALKLPHTGQAVIIDAGEVNIHPYQKRSAGERLARLALARTYGRDIVDSGPTFRSLQVELDGRVSLFFDDVADGLKAKSVPEFYYRVREKGTTEPLVRNSPDSELEGFALQAADGSWHWAQAKIDGRTVLVWSDSVAKPIAVRYNWQRNPSGNLYNSADLPAGPFEIDI